MHCKSCAGTCDAVSGLQVNDAFANRNHRSRAAVPRALWLIESITHCLDRREDSVTLHLADYFPHQIRPGLGFLKQAFLGKLRGCALGPRRNNGGRDAHQHTARKQSRRRNFCNRDLARTCILENLFQ